MRSLLLVVAAVTGLAGAACAQKAPAGTVVDGDVGLRLDEAVTRSAPTFWGAVLVAIDGKVVLAKGHGFADRSRIAAGPQTLFDLGGAAQQLTLLAALRLVAERRLQLDDPVGKHVAEWPAERSALTVRDLLEHRSGLPPDLSWPPGAAQSARSAAAYLARAPLAGRIGSEVRPAAANANLLALVLEAAGQQRFERMLLDRVCRPAGMAGAMPLGQRADAKLVAARRSPANERGEPADRAEWNWSHRGARGVLASVLDVHALLAALTGGTLLGDEGLLRLWQPLAGDDYGVEALPGNGETLVRVHGRCAGFRARWQVQRRTRSWVVLLSEDYGNLDAVETALAAAAWQFAAAVPPPGPPAAGDARTSPPAADATAPAVPGWPSAAAARFAGTYALPRGGGRFVVERCADGLRLVGVGLQASVRTSEGRWPSPAEERLRRAEDRGLHLLDRLVAGDREVARQGFADLGAGATAQRELVAWVEGNGAPVRTEYVGTTLAGGGASWFRLIGPRACAVVRATWADAARFAQCALTTEPIPFAVPLSFVRDDVAEGTVAGRRIVVTIEGRDGARRLVFEDETPGHDGLLDCDLVANGG